MGESGKCHTRSALPLGKTWYLLYRRLGGPHSWSGQVQNILPLLEFVPQTIQPLLIHYTDYSLPASQYVSQWQKIIKLMSSDIHHNQILIELWHIILQTVLNYTK